MLKTICFVAFVGFILASPRSLKVEEDLHEIAKSVKSSDKYSLEEKREILSTLKEMNKDAKHYDSATGSEKLHLKKDLNEKMAKLKTEMPDNEMVSAHHSAPAVSHHSAVSKHRSFEEEEAQAKIKVERVHEGIKSLKDELKTKVLSSTDKKAAKSLYHKLESEYTKLTTETSKEGRKKVAGEMKETLAKLRSHMNNDKTHARKHAIESKKSVVASIDSTKQAKKDKIMSLVKKLN